MTAPISRNNSSEKVSPETVAPPTAPAIEMPAHRTYGTLGSLAEPRSHCDPCNLTGFSASQTKLMLERMIRIRASEECIGNYVESGDIKCPCHLGIGQEAAAVGTCFELGKRDRCFGAHRSHSHYLALGAPLAGLMCEVLGKDAGCSKGMGGSMHIISKEHGLYGTVPIVGATIPIATGAALALKHGDTGGVAVSFLGDGACEEGVFHESLNFASTHNLPVIFVVENNLFSSHLHISLRQPDDRIARFAEANCINHQTIDGNDVTHVANVMNEAVRGARNENKPFLIEAVTYRWRGHVGHREDNDVGVERSKDLAVWKERDPIKRMTVSMVNSGHISDLESEKMWKTIRNEVKIAWQCAIDSPYPKQSALMDRVWCSEGAS
jgi:TPP-dependent pyruvate/acetoin dehydrogenase alpha subunit